MQYTFDVKFTLNYANDFQYFLQSTVVALGLVFVVMMSDVVARPEPLPMFLVNRAIKAAGKSLKLFLQYSQIL